MSGVDPEMVRRLRSFRRVLLLASAGAAAVAIWAADPISLILIGVCAVVVWVMKP